VKTIITFGLLGIGIAIVILASVAAVLSFKMVRCMRICNSKEKFLNTDKYFCVYPGQNTDLSVITYNSESDIEKPLANAIFFAWMNGLAYRLERRPDSFIYCDLATDTIYKYSCGRFVEFHKERYVVHYIRNMGQDLAEEIEILDKKKGIHYEFKYKKEF